MVSTKPANRPFLAYKEYKDQQEALHQAWVKKKKDRDEKIARGEKVGPLEPDPTAQEEVGLVGLMKFILILIVFTLLAGKFFTGSFLWEYESKWTRLKTYWPTNQLLFSERKLATFDGSNQGQPIYLAIDGDVYDVSSNRETYGPGGSYHMMAGVDAARSFATGCFATHRTHDVRGLNEQERAGLDHWKEFFADHKTYLKVGKVVHHPIDPSSPIPEHCDPKKRQDSDPKKSTTEDVRHPAPKPEDRPHEEL
jgi:predicted heme/steroid binding protein